MRKFSEIQAELAEKQKIISNSINHVKFQIQKLRWELEELNTAYDTLDHIINNMGDLGNYE